MSALSIKTDACRLAEIFYRLTPSVQHRVAEFYRQQLLVIDPNCDAIKIIQPATYKLWMVYSVNRSMSAVAHRSKKSADAEARRLARKHPGDRIVVLESTHGFEKRGSRVVSVAY